MLVDELLAYLFDGQGHLLAAQMATWLASSRRFREFVESFRPKVRKKLRARQDVESQLDLQLELETAYLLLQEPRFSLVYEPQLGGKTRGPDFAVTYTSSVVFMVEVTRLRPARGAAAPIPHEQGQTRAADTTSFRSPVEERLTDLVCSKLGQLQPQRTNILLAGLEPPGLTQDTLRTGMLHLQQRAERNEPAVVGRYGLRDRGDFFKYYQRLSEVIVRGTPLQARHPAIDWVNPQARYPLPAKVRRALYRSQGV
jgi:hypothetical protein